MKQGLHQENHALRSKKLDMVRQELWGLLLAYNLVRIVMIDATKEQDERTPTMLSFNLCMRHVVTFFITATIRNASKLPVRHQDLLDTLRLFTLPNRKPDRHYPGEVRKNLRNIPIKNASQLN
ncbi:hypothetical protein [Paraglaciecola sp.]|uniref:hypothetical protein n=1 Tax=Paraglaciecola sp. TaxID=1920173 RepID=UPI00273D6103|nr:hypothetical protein [Paraglaciecola sp.]MDP5033301.1 hypothetical protein [Paraglaciecola sp.]